METNILNEKKISRRSFIFGIAATSAGVMFGIYDSILSKPKFFSGNSGELESFTPNIWLIVDKDNSVTITVSRSEMGQGIRTSLAMILADELDADWNNVKVNQADADSKYGSQSTNGSMSIRSLYTSLRQAGATARSMFITAAAKTWNINESACSTSNGFVIETAGSRKLSYGDLVDTASGLPIPPSGSISLKNPKDFILIGKNIQHIDNNDIVSGKAIYGIDVKLSGMKYAAMAFQPAYGASVSSYDDTDALKIPGVLQSVKISEGVAIIAENTYSAFLGVNLLNITWNMGPNSNLDSKKIQDTMNNNIGTLPNLPGSTVKKIDAVYQVPYLAHAAMEPMNCTAFYQGGKCEVWAPTQEPQETKSAVASALGLSAGNVTVHVTLLGGAFGRRNYTDFATVAAKLSKQTNLPIKLLYSRENDIRHDYYRPASIHALRAGFDSTGKLTGWIHKCAGATPNSPLYNLPSPQNLSASGYGVVPTGAWRSVDENQVAFSNESFIDELAFAAGIDPLDYRISLSSNNKITGVLNELKTRSNWGAALPKGSGRGVAVHSALGGYAGHVIEVTVSPDGILKINRVIIVCDVGIAINTNMIESQMMGGAIDGLSTALKAEITIKSGMAEQSNFNDFQWLRINESPPIEIYILQTGTNPAGVGELGIPTVAPALCNAIFNATGIRVRTLPISHTNLATGVKKNDSLNDGLNIFPNPFHDELNIEYNVNGHSTGYYSIEVFDIIGSRVWSNKSYSPGSEKISIQVNLSSLPPGVYLIKLNSGDLTVSGKVIKE